MAEVVETTSAASMPELPRKRERDEVATPPSGSMAGPIRKALKHGKSVSDRVPPNTDVSTTVDESTPAGKGLSGLPQAKSSSSGDSAAKRIEEKKYDISL